jgi:glycosyltransferase involved in cell wall biosynthesis
MLTTGLGRGGAEAQVYLLASGLKKRGWQVRVVSIIPPEHFVEELEAEGIPVETLGMVRGVPDPRALWRLARILRRFRPAILHAHMIHANLLARLARLLAPVPRVICTAHNTIEVGRSFRTERSTHLAYRYTDFLCDLTTQVSMEGYRRFLEGGATRADKLRYVPNAVDVRRFIPQPHLRLTVRKELGIPEGTFCWLAVGRLEEAKDYPTLLQAFSQVAVEHPEAQLVIVGQGTLEAELKEMAGRLSLADRVRFLGLRTDVASLMNAADAFVMSSAWEGMPMVVLEAQASGLPVVATHVGGIPEVVVPGKTGCLVPPRDPDALADAMKKLMALPPEERVKMGLAGREQVVARYSLEAILDLWEEIYESLLRPRGGPASGRGTRI